MWARQSVNSASRVHYIQTPLVVSPDAHHSQLYYIKKTRSTRFSHAVCANVKRKVHQETAGGILLSLRTLSGARVGVARGRRTVQNWARNISGRSASNVASRHSIVKPNSSANSFTQSIVVEGAEFCVVNESN